MNTLQTEPESFSIPIASPAVLLRLLKFEEPRARILYADDDASIRRLGQLVLARSGSGVDVAVVLYHRTHCLWLDVGTLLRTPLAVLRQVVEAAFVRTESLQVGVLPDAGVGLRGRARDG